jgi:gliding motility-associated-like protein
MKNKFKILIVTVVTLLAFPKVNFGQAPPLGLAADFALISTAGAITSSSTLLYKTHVTGNIGAAPASITGFGNVDGVLYQGGTIFDSVSTNVNAAYSFMNGLTPTNVIATPFGGGNTLAPGVHAVSNAAIWFTGDLILDANNDPNAVFVFKLDGALNVSPNSKIKLIRGAQSCNVFWMINGAVTMDAGVTMHGTIITYAGAIVMGAGDSLVGRAFAINEAISVNETTIYIPLGCGRTALTGPAPVALYSLECFAVFSAVGPVVDNGNATFATGDIGSADNAILTYDDLKVTGTVHRDVTNPVTDQAATELTNIYNGMVALPYDIELMWPSLLGHNLVLTPHTYLLNAAVTFTDSLYLDAQGNPDAVFVFKVEGQFDAGTNANVVLRNGAQAKNVFWKINGELNILTNQIFNGTLVSYGAINIAGTGGILNGRALTMVGAINTSAARINTPSGASGSAGIVMGPDTVCQGQTGVIFTVDAINNATSYIWTLPAGATITSGNNTNSITVSFDQNATSGTWNITVQGSSYCGDGTVSSNFEVVVTEPSTVNTVNNQNVCSNELISPIIFSGGSVGTIYNWTNNNTSIGLAASGSGDIASFTGINNGTGPSTSLITVTPSNGCPGVSTSFTITVNQVPTMDPVSDQIVCGNENTTTVNFSGVSPSTMYNWTNTNTSIGLAASGSGDINSFTANNTGANSAISTITVTPSEGGCLGESTSFTFTVNPSPTVDFIQNQNVCNGMATSAVIFSGNNAATTYNWTNNNTSLGLAASGSGDINSFTASNTGTAIITVIPEVDGCQGASSVFIIEGTDCNDFNIPEGFSPNGDNINDLFVIRGIDRFPSNSFVVFNRWGDKLFEASPYQNTWDGKASTGIRVGGDELPVGTYFYVLTLGDGSSDYKGTIYLKR